MDVHSCGCDISRRVSNVVDAGASVCPQHWTRASVCSLTASSAGIAAGSPASIRQDSCDPRNLGRTGEVLIRRSIVGTANIQVIASSAMTPSIWSASNRSRNTFVPPHRRVGSTLQPPAYTRGAHCRVLGLRVGPCELITQVLPRIAARAPRWEMEIPFGVPVEPELNRMW